MNKSHIDLMNDLLPRYCNGELSEEENQQVEEWIKASPENYRIVKQMHTLCLAIDLKDMREKINTEKALFAVNSRMSKSNKMSWLVWLQRVAAILFIPLLITFLISKDNSSSPVEDRWAEIKTNPGMTTEFTLPDGTLVSLNSESSLSYPLSFTGDVRSVKLNGEGWFSVAKDTDKRFIVSTPHDAAIEVTGTQFNIEAFERDSFISTTLQEGTVNFLFKDAGQEKTYAMKPGDKLVYHTNNSSIDLFNTTGDVETSWKDGKVMFINTPFADALRMLEKRYDVIFEVKNARYREYSFTGTFTHQRLEYILENFKISSGIRWRYIPTDDLTNKTGIEIY